jgi:hypothetical protein
MRKILAFIFVLLLGGLSFGSYTYSVGNVSDLTFSTNGVHSFPNTSRVEVRHAIAQSIPNGAWTTVTFEAEDVDTRGEINASGVFTAEVAGTYVASWKIDSVDTAWDAGEGWLTALVRNNSLTTSNYWKGFLWRAQAGVTEIASSIGSATIYLSASDNLRIQVNQDQGAAVNTDTDADCYFHVSKVN